MLVLPSVLDPKRTRKSFATTVPDAAEKGEIVSSDIPYLNVVWGPSGLRAAGCDVVAIVDVLSFSSAVVAGCSRGAVIFPYQWSDGRVSAYAESVGASIAVHRQDRHRWLDGGSAPSLSPLSLLELPRGYRLVLPSPNGSTLAAECAGSTVIAACLRNASAVGTLLNQMGQNVTAVAAGERWPDGTLRVALEDLIGVGALVKTWTGEKSVEAIAAQAVFERFSIGLEATLLATDSGRELAEKGYESDVTYAAQLDADSVVPILKEGAFRAGPDRETVMARIE